MPLALVMALGAATAHGVLPIPIANSGFENPVVTDGTLGPAPTGWPKFNGTTINTLHVTVTP